ncbi:FdrA family protein [Streptomyces sp. CA-106110]|uniref:FdrA family protein n=1 Tax=Streptomyces sp. CA-106110 TaxID=3240044 RepID=UPI003D8DDFBC
MKTTIRLFKDTYVDSVIQLSGTRAMRQAEGVDWAAAAMATPANLDILRSEGFTDDCSGAGANDLFLAVRAAGQDAIDAALTAGEIAMFAARAGGDMDAQSDRAPRTLERALENQPSTNVAVISVPGDYAALEAHKALSAGLDVLLFSDNVSVEDEIALKERAERLGHLVMGPGAGTAMLGRTCLGFANVVEPGRVGVIAAAGTGAQEVATLLDRWGVGVSHVIGLGGRDLSGAVGGRMAKVAVKALCADPDTDVILLVSKPPEESVARSVVETAQDKPLVAALIGLQAEFDVPAHVALTGTLEGGAVKAVELLGADAPNLTGNLRQRVAEAGDRLGPDRTLIRGLYSGGTLCYESLVILSKFVGPVHSNTPIQESWMVPEPPGSHVCLDLGEEEYTKGRPHPMIDPEARIELLRKQGADPQVAAILMDVVLGHGAHPDPAGQLAPVCADIAARGGPVVVAYVLGTERDPQGLEAQRRALEEAGCIVTETAARASLAAAAIALRDPDLVGEVL